MNQYDDLIICLKERVQEQPTHPNTGYYYPGPARPPLAPEQIEQAESQLGFRLPPLMVRLYSEVADGFWGPGYGLNPLLASIPDIGVVSIVESKKSYPEIGWPSNLIFLCSYGCGFEAYVNHMEPTLPVIYEDCDGPNDDYMRWPSGYSLDEYLQAWLDGGSMP